MFLLTNILPVDSAEAAGVHRALGSATQPINLNYRHWFGTEQLEGWLDGAINFGLRVLLVIVLFWLGRIVIRWIGRLFDNFLRRRSFDGVALYNLRHRLSEHPRCQVRILRCRLSLYGLGCGYGTEWTAAELSRRCHHHGHEALWHR